MLEIDYLLLIRGKKIINNYNFILMLEKREFHNSEK